MELEPIRIGGFTINLVEDDTLQYMQLCAAFDGNANRIMFRTDCDPQITQQSIVHETGHAIESIYLEGDALSERQLSAFTQGWFQVLRDNPKLVEYITGEVEEK